MAGSCCTLKLTPNGRLVLQESDDAHELAPELARRLKEAFARGPGFGLLQLGAREVGATIPAVFAYWREFAARFVTALCTRTAADEGPFAAPDPPAAEMAELSLSPPEMTGAEYITPDVLRALWREIGDAFAEEMSSARLSLQPFLKSLNPAWNLVGRVHFNLAENRKDEEAPFAFLATYTTRLSSQARAQHLPLGQALKEYAGASNQDKLLSLLLPVQRAAERCAWLRSMVDEHEIFHPIRWTPPEAFRFLQDAHELENAGVVVRMPAAWHAGRPPRPRVTATVGRQAPAGLGTDALLDFSAGVVLDGEKLTRAEIDELLSGTDGLALIRGRWVEVDREKLARTLEQFRRFEQIAAREGISFAEAMRLIGARYFQAMEIPLQQGRFFNEQDTAAIPRVAIIDENMTHQFWHDQDPIGKRFHLVQSTIPWHTIVGVVGRVKHDALDSDPRIVFYLPQTQYPTRAMTVVFKSHSDPEPLSSAVKEEVRNLDPELPIYNLRTMGQFVDQSLARRRFSMLLLSIFAGLALALAAVGIYGVMAYLVSQGMREIGIRIALGASQNGILGLIVGQGMILAIAGVAIGLVGALALTRPMAALLFGVTPTDPSTFAVIPAVLILVALLASYIPARRAARVDPMASLRCE